MDEKCIKINPDNINSIFVKAGNSAPEQLRAKIYEIIYNTRN
jgi:hypothetical protein